MKNYEHESLKRELPLVVSVNTTNADIPLAGMLLLKSQLRNEMHLKRRSSSIKRHFGSS